jgi:hypothetical protein
MLTTGSAVIPSADAPLSPEIPGLHLLPPLHTFQDGKSHFGHKLFLRFTTDFTLPCGKVITSTFDSGNDTDSRLCYCRAEIISKMESMGVDSIQDVMAHVPGLRLTGASFILNHIRTCKFMSKAAKEAATSGYKGNYLVLDKNSLRSIIDEIAALDNETATLSLSSYRMEVRAAEYEVGERGLMDLVRYWRIPLPNESRAHNGGMEKGALVNAIVNAIQDGEYCWTDIDTCRRRSAVHRADHTPLPQSQYEPHFSLKSIFRISMPSELSFMMLIKPAPRRKFSSW